MKRIVLLTTLVLLMLVINATSVVAAPTPRQTTSVGLIGLSDFGAVVSIETYGAVSNSFDLMVRFDCVYLIFPYISVGPRFHILNGRFRPFIDIGVGSNLQGFDPFAVGTIGTEWEIFSGWTISAQCGGYWWFYPHENVTAVGNGSAYYPYLGLRYGIFIGKRI